jgi:FtsZ-interacting cell division protein ZipA
MDQSHVLLVIVVVIAIVVVAAIGWFYSRKRRTRQLRERFGPEYDRVVHREGNLRKAEGVLEWRTKNREQLRIVPLSAEVRSDFANRWTKVQARFVDDPKGAVAEADQLVSEVMHVRGYPMSNFEQQADAISVDHPVVVQNYRAGHEIAVRHSQGKASTEDLRKAMVHYRSLFEELLKDSVPERKEARG